MQFSEKIPVKSAGKYRKVRVDADTVTSQYDIEAVVMQFRCDGVTYPVIMVKPEVSVTNGFTFKFTGFDPITGTWRDFRPGNPQRIEDNRPLYQKGHDFTRRLALLGVKWYCLHFVANHYDVITEKWQGGEGETETAWSYVRETGEVMYHRLFDRETGAAA